MDSDEEIYEPTTIVEWHGHSRNNQFIGNVDIDMLELPEHESYVYRVTQMVAGHYATLEAAQAALANIVGTFIARDFEMHETRG